jgi:hypothetical protein
MLNQLTGIRMRAETLRKLTFHIIPENAVSFVRDGWNYPCQSPVSDQMP